MFFSQIIQSWKIAVDCVPTGPPLPHRKSGPIEPPHTGGRWYAISAFFTQDPYVTQAFSNVHREGVRLVITVRGHSKVYSSPHYTCIHCPSPYPVSRNGNTTVAFLRGTVAAAIAACPRDSRLGGSLEFEVFAGAYRWHAVTVCSTTTR